MSWTFCWYSQTDLRHNPSLGEDWRQCFRGSPAARVFQSPELVLCWIETKGRALGFRLSLCRAKCSSGNEVWIPFGTLPRRSGNLWRQRLVAVGEPHFDYQDPLWSPIIQGEAALHGLLTDLEYELAGRPFDSATLLRLRQIARSEGLPNDAAVEAPYADLSRCSGWDDYLAQRPESHRGDVRRQQRRLAEIGVIRLETIPGNDLSTARRELDAMVQRHEERWQGAPSAHLFRQPGTRDFYERLLTDLLPTGMVHLSVLRVGDRPISWHVGFLHAGVLSWYKPVYDPAFESYSPGKVHLARLIQLGFASGWREIDFGGGREEYKYRWSTGVRPLWQWNWESDSVTNRLRQYVRRRLRRSHVGRSAN